MVDSAEIYVWKILAGAVRWDDRRKLASFQFTDEIIEKGYDLAPLKMPIDYNDRIYSFPELRHREFEETSTFKGLPGLLADALPDRYGNQLINTWLARNGRPPNSMNPVEQLCFIGSRGMGALEFLPSKNRTSDDAFAIEVDSLVSAAQMMLANRMDLELNFVEKDRAMREILKIGTSAGGARPKAVIAFNKSTREVRSGQSTVPPGFEHWLIKLDGVSSSQFGASHGFGRVEYAYYLMAKDCGIEIMECELLEENERAHFMTKRFDRGDNNIKHHTQTFCGIQHFDYNQLFSFSYEQLFQTMRMLKLTYPEAEEMFRRMVFNVMATNYDDHTKNFSFLLKKDQKWTLAPAYDICYSYNPDNTWVSQHTLSINSKHKNISKKDLLTIADNNNIKAGKDIIEHIQDVVCNWQDYAKTSCVHAELSSEIASNLWANKIS